MKQIILAAMLYTPAAFSGQSSGGGLGAKATLALSIADRSFETIEIDTNTMRRARIRASTLESAPLEFNDQSYQVQRLGDGLIDTEKSIRFISSQILE